MRQLSIMLFAFCLFLGACNLPQAHTNEDTERAQIETIVAATAQILTLQATDLSYDSTSTQTNFITPALSSTFTPNITETPEPGFGSISGNIYGYPYGDLPRLAIVAHGQQPPFYFWYLITIEGENYYSWNDGFISSGKYQVVAYDSSGHTGGCATIVEVKNGERVNCDITNWGGGYPPKPASVPLP